MQYDADDRLSKLERPSIKLGGQTYIGRLLSIEEWEPFEERIEKLKEKKMSEPEVRGLLVDYGHAVFSRRWWEVWKVGRDPTRKILRLPPAVQVEVFTSFFVVQQKSMRLLKVQTSGSN